MKLFAIYIGGEHPGANIELHDMRFVVAPSIEQTYSELRRQWWGSPRSLHIDCWAEITYADGYDVTLRPFPFGGAERLFYINLGGYDFAEFTELHRNMFVVASSESKAKARAVKAAKNWIQLHRDDMYEAEQAFSLNEKLGEERLYIHLTPASDDRSLTFICKYTPISNA